MSLHIPSTKSTKELGADIILHARFHHDPELCGIQAIKHHLTVNNNIPDNFSLFAYLDEHNNLKHMVKQEFLSFCFGIWEKEAMKDILGHSFRISSAVFHLLAGVPPEMVAKIGGWTSLAFLIYWQCVDEVCAKGMVNAFKKQELERLCISLEAFRVKNGLSLSLVEAVAAGLSATIDDCLPEA